MQIRQDQRDGCVIVTLHGGLDLAAAPALHHVLLKRLSERPPAVICDLAALHTVDVVCARVFATAARPAARWPETTLLLANARPAVASVLGRGHASAAVPLYDTVDDALAALAAPGTPRTPSAPVAGADGASPTPRSWRAGREHRPATWIAAR